MGLSARLRLCWVLARKCAKARGVSQAVSARGRTGYKGRKGGKEAAHLDNINPSLQLV